MKAFSSDDSLSFSSPFRVIYHDDHLPSLLEFEAELKEIERKKGSEKPFEHPTIDLASLFDQVKIYGELQSSQDVTAVHNFVQECKDDIELLNSKLPGIMSTISQLCCELSDMSHRLARRQGEVKLGEYLVARNIARLLPQDLLEQIFLESLNSRDFKRQSRNQAPLQLASVCHRWRTIALSMPKLWEGISINKNNKASFSLAKSWIERCYVYRLTIRIDIQTLTPNLAKLLAFLEASPSRLHSLDIVTTPTGADEKIWSQFKQVDCTELEELVLRSSGTQYSLELPPSATQLKRLHLTTTPRSWGNTPPPAQLTVLSITWNVRWSMLEHILTHCRALQSLLIAIGPREHNYFGSPNLDEGRASSQPITHHCLRSLSLINSFDLENLPTQDPLQKPTFPNLSSFEFKHLYRTDSIRWLTSLNFIHQIRRLALNLPTLLGYLLYQVLTVTESLEEISLGDLDRFKLGDIVDTFVSLDDSPKMVPSLQGIQFTFQDSLFYLEPYAHFFSWLIQSASRPIVNRKRLTHLNIGFMNGIDDSVEGFQSRLGDYQGINVKIYGMVQGALLADIPSEFEAYVPPFSEVQEFEVLQPDGTWQKQYGPIFGIVE
ncbi:hypothetical protein BDN72DRAFT_962305 [Pluteus cervinus]|uniref:Uncharacterized protein n=1 Tax=Pluteus cervinus TaxID=181527 RepID=A0ACD3AKJ5_9AGAR|nr:hypothetical protein BDN72DRAFT_962305 [Pluteus cervinus]